MARLCPWLSGALVLALSASAAAAKNMPLTRVRLYETGVAYFERSGKIGDNAVSLPVPASHLDDALKTLVVYSKAGATRVGGVEFASSVSRAMGLALAGLAPGANALSLTVLLTSLKGASVVVSLEHEKLEGRIVDVLDDASDLSTCVRAKPDAPCEKSTVPTLVLLTRTNELHRVPLASVTSARPTDPTVAARLNAALDALSGGSARALKELRVLAQGQNVALGYVSEAPVWRASYRLVLGEGNQAALQGFALVHNDTDEAW
ncbi:MAG TPA: hypothetical protein VGQ57_18660, partial [Polyangiaceae bacterium]|nr:hypothetical protein [Polyangiaceae bacterium]